jgi:hypothetical protein
MGERAGGCIELGSCLNAVAESSLTVSSLTETADEGWRVISAPRVP